MSSEDNKRLVRRFYEAIDNGNFDSLDELLAEGYIDHNPPPFNLSPGRQGIKEACELFWTATPGWHKIEDQVAEGDKVVTRLTAYGKHERDLPGAPATGNDMEVTAVVIHRIEAGKLAEKWSDKNTLALLQQLGKIPDLAPPGPTASADGVTSDRARTS